MELYTKDSMKDLLATNDTAVEHAVLVVFKNQTTTEHLDQATIERNGKGFNKQDAPILSSFAEQLQRGHHFSPRQMEVARRRISKYWYQVMMTANTNIETKHSQQAYQPLAWEKCGDTGYIAEASTLGFKPGETPKFECLFLVSTNRDTESEIRSWTFSDGKKKFVVIND